MKTRNQLLVVVGLTVLIMTASVHECSRLPEEPDIITSARMVLTLSGGLSDTAAAAKGSETRRQRLRELLTMFGTDTADLLSDSSPIGRCLLREQYGEWGEDDEYLARLMLVRELARESGAGVILMHMKGEPRTMQIAPQYDDVVAEVRGFLEQRVREALEAGLDPDAVAVDPGIGFGKTLEHNLELLVRLPEAVPSDHPIVVGVSRKRMLGALTGRDVHERLAAGLAVQSWCIWHGAHVLRVHDVKDSCDAARVADRLRREARLHGVV
ncbi:MAG: dihydropteroate synthase [candidate division WOR-3 bacterium]